MKIKFANLTVQQIKQICAEIKCRNCPLADTICATDCYAPSLWNLDTEIDVPEELLK